MTKARGDLPYIKLWEYQDIKWVALIGLGMIGAMTVITTLLAVTWFIVFTASVYEIYAN